MLLHSTSYESVNNSFGELTFEENVISVIITSVKLNKEDSRKEFNRIACFV